MRSTRTRNLLLLLAVLPIAFAAGRLSAPPTQDDVSKVTGIGGIFFKSRDPMALKQWYAVHFGMPMNEYGAMIEFRDSDGGAKGYLQWSPFAEKTGYFAPSTKDFMINYRVQGIEELVARLKADGVFVTDSIERFDYGKFVHVMDPEGNKLELWEPVDSVFTGLYDGSTVH